MLIDVVAIGWWMWWLVDWWRLVNVVIISLVDVVASWLVDVDANCWWIWWLRSWLANVAMNWLVDMLIS